MFKSHTILFLALGLCINPALASAENASSTYKREQTWKNEKMDSRRRGACVPSKVRTLDVWTLDISGETGQFCYVAQDKVSLWLPEEERLKLKKLVITTRKPKRQRANLDWPADAETLPWPVENIQIQPGVRHSMKLKPTQGASTRKTITLYQIPAEHRKTTAEQAQWMAQNGCVQQAKMLVKQENAPKTSPAEVCPQPAP